METIGFIGAGTTGTALAVRLSQKGCPVVAVSSRTLASAQKLAGLVPGCRVYDTAQELADAVDLVFITTPDDAIAMVCRQVSWRAGQSVVHCSGAHSVNILEPARELGAAVGSMHPLQTFADVSQAVENLPGSTFALEAEDPLLSRLKDLASLLNGKWVELRPGQKVLYHAAAVFACNYLITLVKLSLDLWHEFGILPQEGTQALLPLLEGTINNIRTIGLPGCLTGPIARGDLGTIQRHLSALEATDTALLSTYQELGLQTIPIAIAKGKVDGQRADEMRALLMRAESFADRDSEGAERPRSLATLNSGRCLNAPNSHHYVQSDNKGGKK
ncbi:MAG: DUF2520 domain-containing protein [Dehalococcoidia bacterium]|nr:DUF2520 domain-containing protein [Dehalococcoidia bacterium]